MRNENVDNVNPRFGSDYADVVEAMDLEARRKLKREISKLVPKSAQELLGNDSVIIDEEGLEESYMELVEYLRFAALNVYLDTRSESAQEEPPPSLH